MNPAALAGRSLAARTAARAAVLGDEGLRLFFPLAALHAALWPFLWAVIGGFGLPFEETLAPTLRHANEMLIGAYGAAVIGFITTAVPEWSNTPRLRGRPLFVLAGLWGLGRLAGLTAAPGLVTVGAVADAAWLIVLPGYVAWVFARRRRARLGGVTLWLTALAVAGATAQAAIVLDAVALAGQALHGVALVYVGLVGLVLARVTVPVTNKVLDPSEETTPYRPHPGRLNLAPGLVAVVIAGTVAGLSPAVTGYLMIAAGAAFLDRVAEAFVGREVGRAPILATALTGAVTGLGLLLVGLARLGAPYPETAALHVVLMGGLGLAILTIFAVAGLFHTGRRFPLPRSMPVVFLLVLAATAARALPELGVTPPMPGPPHALAAGLWAAAFLTWLRGYWPILSRPGETE
jgi:uncharacterized protein involved in response to NO